MTATLENITLKHGSHSSVKDGMCAMEACAYIAGEPFSDHPKCVSGVIGAFMRSWNDSLPNDADRTRLLMPLIPKLIGTAANNEIEIRRSFMALDWMIREFTPAWLDLVPSLRLHAAAIRSLPGIVDMSTALTAGELVVRASKDAAAAGNAAGDAAGNAAGDAAGNAAGDAAVDAAGDAARDAAGNAAWAAARDAARAAAWDAARTAARAAAGAAAWDALKPTTKKLQASAIALVERMIAVK